MNWKEEYGEIIIKKDSILYKTHYDQEELDDSMKKSIFYCSFHPSEYGIYPSYISFIKIKHDIHLLFMVKRIDGMRIFSALEDLTSYPLKYLLIIKNKDIVLSEMADKLSKQNLDGWFTSIFNCARTEVGLINNGNVFEIIETKPIKRDWRNGSWISSKKNSIKTWGTNYPFSFIERPIVFNLNEKYKKVIEKYIEYEKTSHKHLEFLFIHILQYSRFT